MRLKGGLLLYLLGWSIPSLFAQVFQNAWVENFDNRNGLSQNTVWSISQDSRGFLWVGTDDGLLRYDGYQFKPYRAQIGQSVVGLPSNSIRQLFHNGDEYLWVGTRNGIAQLNILTDSIRTFLPNVRIRKILPGAKGNLWVCSNKGLYFLDTKSKRTYCKIPHLNILNAAQLDTNRLLISTSENYWLLDVKKNKYKVVSFGLASDKDIRPMQVYNNLIWIGVENEGVWVFDSHSLKLVKKYSLRALFPELLTFPIRSMTIGKNGRCWLSLQSGLVCLDTKTEKMDFLPSDLTYQRLNSLKGAPLNDIFEDNSGLVWVGSNNSGLNKINLRLGKFRTINQDNGLNYNFVLSFAEAGDNLLVGTDGEGINVWNKKTGKVRVCKPETAGQNQLYALTEVESGLFWGATGNGLVQFDASKGKFTAPSLACKVAFDTLQSTAIRTIYMDSRKRVWMGTARGLFTFDYPTKTFRFWANGSGYDDLINSFKEDSKGIIWIGRGVGLQKYSPINETIESVPLVIPSTNIEVGDVSSVNLSSDSVLWISSYRVGFGKYNPLSKQFKLYTTDDGLPNSIVYGSLVDDNGQVWMSTNMGLARFNPKNETFTTFDVHDGIQNNEFNGGAYFKLASGEMAFGGVNGFTIFQPSGLQRRGSSSPVAITEVKVMNHSVNIFGKGMIETSYTENFLSFEFAALDFTSPQKNQYAYQLEGVDKNWIYSGNRHFVSYSQIPPGEYVFKVKASNSDGVWNETPLTLKVRVTAPFWTKDWFRFLAIMAGVAALVVFFTGRIRRIQEREKEKAMLNRQIAALEMKALRAQMNPHFIFNCLNSINNFILHDQNHQASKYLTKFSKLIRQILDNTDTPLQPIERIVTFMNLYVELEQMRFGKNKFDFEIKVDSRLEAHETVFPTMMIQPHVENAIWHGLMHRTEQGKIILSFHRETTTLVSCTIEDNGVGRVKSKEISKQLSPSRKSKGTQNVLESIETFNRQYNTEGAKIIIDDLYDKTGEPSGTKVKIVLPDIAQIKLC